MVITLDFESSDPGSNPGRTSIFYRKNTLPTYGTRAYSVRRLNLLPYLPSTVNNLPITLHNTPCSLCTQPIRFKHNKKKNNWRIRVSIPVPHACKARTLPIELIPHR